VKIRLQEGRKEWAPCQLHRPWRTLTMKPGLRGPEKGLLRLAIVSFSLYHSKKPGMEVL
jgi:hypothetical protein